MPESPSNGRRAAKRKLAGGNGRRRRRHASESGASHHRSLVSDLIRDKDRHSRQRGESAPPVADDPPPPYPPVPPFQPRDHFSLRRTRITKWRLGPVREAVFQIIIDGAKLKDPGLTRQLKLFSILEEAFRFMLIGTPPDSFAQIVLSHPLMDKWVISSCRQKAKNLTFSHVASRLERLLVSETSINLNEVDVFLTTWTPQDQLTVGGPHQARTTANRRHISFALEASRRQCCFDPVPARVLKRREDASSMCFPMLLAKELAVFRLEATGELNAHKRLHNFSTSTQCWEEAVDLVKGAGFEDRRGPFKLSELKSFESVLPPETRVNVFDSSAPPIMSLGAGYPDHKYVINVFLAFCNNMDASDGYHSWGISSLKAFLGASKRGSVCEQCYKVHQSTRLQGHKCDRAVCRLCQAIGCPNRDNSLTPLQYRCVDCNMGFRKEACQQVHNCDHKERCPTCFISLPKKLMPKHIARDKCALRYCMVCGIEHEPLEGCYVQVPPSPKQAAADDDAAGEEEEGEATRRRPGKGSRSVWYADCEAFMDPVSNDHTANLCVLSNASGDQVYEFKGYDCMRQLTAFAIAEDSPLKHSYLIFHNGSSYDLQLWFRELVNLKLHPQNVIRKGQKIISMELPNPGIILRDSLLFLPGTPLSAFTRTFGLPQEKKKGDFPFGVNNPTWVKWDGERRAYKRKDKTGGIHRFPPLKAWWPHLRRGKRLQELEQWHQSQVAEYEADPSRRYYVEEELLAYCRQDVEVLRAGFESCLANWRSQVPGVDPLRFVTFTAFNNYVFRARYLKKGDLAVLPPSGFIGDRQSTFALSWLSWMERQLDMDTFFTARKGGERLYAGSKMDGAGKDKAGRLHLMSMEGCWWHSCPDCYKDLTPEGLKRREATEAINAKIRHLQATEKPYGPFTFHCVRECELRAQLRDPANAEMAAYFRAFRRGLRPALAPRKALRGGRTESIIHNLTQLPEGHRLGYYDYSSMYPAVQWGINGEEYPTGAPDIYLTPAEMDRAPAEDDIFGLIHATVLAPRDLLHPVLGLPVERDRPSWTLLPGMTATQKETKVLYHLCRTCAESSQASPCDHEDKDRAFDGVFCSPELQLARSLGYKVLEYHEVWSWPPERRSSTIFRRIITDQFVAKVTSSGLPKTDELFKALQAELAQLGIHVQKEDFQHNPAMRQLAKIAINAIWGYLGKRGDVTKTTIADSMDTLYKIQNDPSQEVTEVQLSPDGSALYIMHRDLVEKPGKSQSIVLAAFTTAWGRVCLYNAFKDRQEQVVYKDTDSLILLMGPGDEPPVTSTSLGGLKDEILEEFGPGARLTQFSACGAKCYFLRVEAADGTVLKEELKVKGLSQTTEAMEVLSAPRLQSLTDSVAAWLSHKDTTPTDDPQPSPALSPPCRCVLRVPQSLIRRDLFNQRLFSHTFRKLVRFTSDKRFFPTRHVAQQLWPSDSRNRYLRSLPFGYAL